MEEKTMQFANFNITFGEKAKPMLTHFLDAIFPAFTGNYQRGKTDKYPVFILSDIKIKEIKTKEAKIGEYVLVGNFIKETEYTVRTTVKNGELTVTPAKHPTAPYSRFIIFLKNHRMILVRNESASPDIKSFQATVRHILNKHIREINKNKNKNNIIPDATVNIVDIPLPGDIKSVLKKVEKVTGIKLRFFPLNNDFDQSLVASTIRDGMKSIGSDTAHITFNSPASKEGVGKLLKDTSGQVASTLYVRYKDGETDTIREDMFSANKKIPFSRDITADDDQHLIALAQKDKVITITSEENKSLYERCLSGIRSLI